jgi:hypothetical protein
MLLLLPSFLGAVGLLSGSRANKGRIRNDLGVDKLGAVGGKP